MENEVEEDGHRMAEEDCAIYIYYTDAHFPIGFAQCGLRHDYVEGAITSPVGYLERIFIREEYRKNGYAGSCWLNMKTGQSKRGVRNLPVIVSW